MKTGPNIISYITAVCLLLSAGDLKAKDAFTVSTFHCISIYWTPPGGSRDKHVLVKYKADGTSKWKNALPMKYNPIEGCGKNPVTGKRYDKADYRGSIVNLTPGKKYDIRLTLEGTSTTATVSAATWSETFPIGKTITPGDRTTQYTATESGTADGYILIDGTGATINIKDMLSILKATIQGSPG